LKEINELKNRPMDIVALEQLRAMHDYYLSKMVDYATIDYIGEKDIRQLREIYAKKEAAKP